MTTDKTSITILYNSNCCNKYNKEPRSVLGAIHYYS